MREFALFIQPIEDNPLQEKEYFLKTLTEFPGSSQLKELDEVVDGHLKLVSETKEFRHFIFSFEYYRRRSSVSDERPRTKGKFEVWQHKGGFCVAVDAPMVLSKVVAAFLSVVQYNELRAIHLLEMDYNRFVALRQHALELGGRINMLHLKNIESENINLNVFQIHGKDVEKMNVDEMLKNAKKIKRVGFNIPNLAGEPFSFWVADWGGGAIYRPKDFLLHQVSGFLEFFEEKLHPNKSKTKRNREPK